jgi:multidrug transporter EmrE-like cation transporter
VGIYYACLVAGVLFGIAGQITLKAGAMATDTVVAQFLNPLTIVGFGIYVIAAFLYIVALKKIPVSVAFPSVAASYAVVAIVAHVLWQEPFGLPQIGGLVLIGGGILLIHQY